MCKSLFKLTTEKYSRLQNYLQEKQHENLLNVLDQDLNQTAMTKKDLLDYLNINLASSLMSSDK